MYPYSQVWWGKAIKYTDRCKITIVKSAMKENYTVL